MFIFDKPIMNSEEDFLGRTSFSKQLGESIQSWTEKESLVIALYGKWGTGKSSVINLAKEHIKKSSKGNKPTIIDFNPWLFSDSNSITQHFFEEVAKELEIKSESKKDKKIADKLRLYANLTNIIPEKQLVKDIYSKIILGLGLASISISQVMQWLNISSDLSRVIFFIIGFLFIIVEMFKSSLLKLADFFDQKSKDNEKTILQIKNDIQNELIERDKKLLIVIDDIDRLNQTEIRQVFRLIRINADFPNTIYLLSFDRKIIELNLEEQSGICGKEYLEKIVQVNFDIPLANSDKITGYLFTELDRILDDLPKVALEFFDSNPYWANIYHSGFKLFFKNIRDVKRFCSSLEFNISLMHEGGVMEVNPIDFIAIEAIRLFVPDFYQFLKSKKELFISTRRESNNSNENPRKREIEDSLEKLTPEVKGATLKLIRQLFPQIQGVFEYGYSTYGHEWQSEWSKDLRICSNSNFDSYFTLTPGGSENEISRFELELLFNQINNTELLEKTLSDFITSSKIRKLLVRIQDFTNDETKIPNQNIINIVQALFNISDCLSNDEKGMLGLNIDTELIRVIYQLLKRVGNTEETFKILKKSIQNSRGLFGPIRYVSFESSPKGEITDSKHHAFDVSKMEELQQLCIDKIIEFKSKGDIIQHHKFTHILIAWKEWDKRRMWEDLVNEILKDDNTMVSFLEKFVSEIRSQTIGDYGVVTTKKIQYKSLNNYADLEVIKARLQSIKGNNQELYKLKKSIIDLFLNNFDKKDQVDPWD